MERKRYVIVVAGGNGTRMGTDTPKQFLELGGVPILQRTIEKFVDAVPGIRVVTVLPAAHIRYWKDMCMERGFNVPQVIAQGGITRFHSVQSALAKVPDGAVVAIQDAVRPLLSLDLIRDMFDAMSETTRALVPVVPVADTLKNTDPAGPDPDRSRIVAVQTPQIFLSEDIKAAYTQGFSLAFTDDASVAKAYKIPLTYAQGERYNIKITTPEDLRMAGFLLG